MKHLKWALCLAVMALTSGAVFNQEAGKDKADDKAKKADKEPADKPATHTVAKKPFKLEVSASGILSSPDSVEISYRPQPLLHPPEGQNPLVVKEVARHGTSVKKGDLLIAFDTTKLKAVIANAESDQAVLEANIKLAAEELPLQEKSNPLEMALAETAKKRADEELKYFLETGRPQAEKEANYMVKTMKFYVEYTEEELAQLKKMYKSNDLTESTERMVLRRQQHMVERMQFWYQSAIIDRDYALKYTLPNREKALKDDQARTTLALERTQKTTMPNLTQKQTSLVKQRLDYAEAADRLAKLRKDLAAMTITAPMDGVVYHGRFFQGTWTTADGADSKLMAGAQAQADKVLLTVLKPRASEILLTIDEKDAYLLKPDSKGTAKLTARPERRLPVRVASVSATPIAPGKFAALVRIEDEAADGDLVAGLACSVKFTAYARKDAITVPNKCIHEEDGKDFVYILTVGTIYQKREVAVGRSDGTNTEILSGLREKEHVLLDDPTENTKLKEKGAP